MVTALVVLILLAVVLVLALGWAFSWPLVRLFDPVYERLAHQVPRGLSSSRLQHRVLRAALDRISVGVHGGVMAPTDYEVHLAPEDVEVLGGLKDWFAGELSGAIADAARERGAPVARPPSVTVVEDETRPRSRPLVHARFETPTQVVGAAGWEGEPATAVEHGTVALTTWLLVPDGEAAAAHDAGAIRLEGTKLVVGRSRSSDAVVDDAAVSSRHARFRSLPDGRWEVADLGSTNGTRLNGERLAGAAVLAEGDRLAIGGVTWRLELR